MYVDETPHPEYPLATGLSLNQMKIRHVGMLGNKVGI